MNSKMVMWVPLVTGVILSVWVSVPYFILLPIARREGLSLITILAVTVRRVSLTRLGQSYATLRASFFLVFPEGADRSL